MLSPAPSKLIGRSPPFLHALALMERMAHCEAPVLIQGETGTGKELAARAIHYHSARREGPFVPLNCGAVPEALIESELFGCERGAFTDARQARSGLVAAAVGGTLFLDELDSLPLRAQVSLLRFLQDYRYRPVGGTRECTGDVRIIAAASPRLNEMLNTGAFRDDLAFRLNVLLLEMPPLRERAGDARILADHFIARHARQHDRPLRRLHAQSLRWLEAYPWPGNVRELDNRVQRALLLSDDEELLLDPGAMPAARPAAADAHDDTVHAFNEARERALQCFERDYLQRLMQATDGNVTHAARLAGKERRSLGKLLKKHGIKDDPLVAPLHPSSGA
ncbi:MULTISPECIES: sigma 54-interacting transcriptional regulator [unclassified Rhizobacter]|uniref:sigma 54-interacting transcriptional regulator n=1 Tax=unclassified Rhizobacter TaxID=2640088 RepID=UPI0006F59036|nr:MULTISPECIES: sigma-54 dependent transcriptional regulator [unclassified Rhizobacter]KQU77074.1 Fis family transcriptional regulator [Rhizobacter sp. Root29]KQW14239.1 Fis family transcriptional regulator [Rhizobacter sp. Root1238]KRB18604.1 Fis family transcriptional regulator [Rhizobacter sp. Root16D2]